MMEDKISEIVIHGARSAGMSHFLIDHGATLLRIEPINRYIFVYNDVFQDALAELQIALRRGFYFTDDEEVKTE